MRYVKVLLLVLVFFLTMVFFFQNQEPLSKEMVLKMHLFFTPPMASIPLPLYLLLLASFVVGAVVTLCILLWDKIHLSARHMKATWRVRSLEKEVTELKAAQNKPQSSGSFFSRKPKEEKKEEKAEAAPAPAKVETPVEDVKAPDPDKHA